MWGVGDGLEVIVGWGWQCVVDGGWWVEYAASGLGKGVAGRVPSKAAKSRVPRAEGQGLGTGAAGHGVLRRLLIAADDTLEGHRL